MAGDNNEAVVEDRKFVAFYNDPKERVSVKYDFKLSEPCHDPMMRKYIETHIDELIYMLPGGGITFMYNPGNVFKLHQQQRTAQPPLRGEVVGRRLDVLLRAQIHFGRRS